LSDASAAILFVVVMLLVVVAVAMEALPPSAKNDVSFSSLIDIDSRIDIIDIESNTLLRVSLGQLATRYSVAAADV
jgi:hypothetical protein